MTRSKLIKANLDALYRELATACRKGNEGAKVKLRAKISLLESKLA